MKNQLKTIFLMGVLAGLVIIMFRIIGGPQYLILGLVFALGLNLFSYWFSDKLVLKMYRAKEITLNENPKIHKIVEDLCRRGNLPKPKIYLIDNPSPNAFATGRDPHHSSVAVTSGILNLLNADELTGVLGHELTHIKNKDILIATMAAVMATLIMYLANMLRWTAFFSSSDDDNRGNNLLVAILLPIIAGMAAFLIQSAISRSREYLADEGGAKLSGNPLFLAAALGKLASGVSQNPLKQNTTATSSLFIVNPFKADKIANWFSTHPSTEERINKLQQMKANLDYLK